MRASSPRPMGVTILGVLGIMIGLLSICGGATVIANTSDIALLGLNAVAIVLGVLFLVSGIGFFQAIGGGRGL